MGKLAFSDLLPSVPTAVEKIQAFFQEDYDLNDLISFLQADPVLSLHILHLINSPYYGLKHNVTSIRQAVMLLGGTLIRGMVLAAVIKKSFPVDLGAYNMSIEKLEEITLLRVRFAEGLCKHLGIDLSELIAKIFLMEDGKLLTSFALKERKLTDKFKQLVAEKPVLEAELEVLGLTNYEAMGTLLSRWNFDENFAKAFFHITAPSTKEEEALYMLSMLINSETIFDDKSLQKCEKFLEAHDISRERFLEVVTNIKKEL